MKITQTAQQYIARINEEISDLDKYLPTRTSKLFAVGALALAGTLLCNEYLDYRFGKNESVKPNVSYHAPSQRPQVNVPAAPVVPQVPVAETNKVSKLEKSLELPGIKPEINRDDVWGIIVR